MMRKINTVRVKCLAQEHNIVPWLGLGQTTWTVRSGFQRTNQKTTASPTPLRSNRQIKCPGADLLLTPWMGQWFIAIWGLFSWQISNVARGNVRHKWLTKTTKAKHMLTNEHQLLQRSNSAKHRINRLSGKKSICLKFVFWYFKYQLLQKIGRSMSQEFQNVMLVAPTYSKDCYHTFLVKYHGFDRNCWPTNKNPRLRDLAAKNLRIGDAKKWDSKTHSKLLRDLEIGRQISETMIFPGTLRHPLIYISKWTFVR